VRCKIAHRFGLMINPYADINWRPDRQDCRAFAKSVVIGFPMIAVTFAVLVRWQTGVWAEWPWWLGVIGFTLGVVCGLCPPFAKLVYVAWHALGGAVGFVVSNLLLVATFYLIVTPIGLVLRCVGKDPLERRIDRDAQSYWKDEEKRVDDAQEYFRPF
jgi:hypothetical protein